MPRTHAKSMFHVPHNELYPNSALALSDKNGIIYIHKNSNPKILYVLRTNINGEVVQCILSLLYDDPDNNHTKKLIELMKNSCCEGKSKL
jgi:hypothetical protein